MKNLFTILFTLVCLAAVAGEPTESKTLRLDGEFLIEHGVRYEVFAVLHDKSCEFISSDKSYRYFCIVLNSGFDYMIRFTSKDGKVKYLYVENTCKGDFVFDVDFARNTSGLLKYDRKANKLVLEKIDTKELPTNYAKN